MAGGINKPVQLFIDLPELLFLRRQDGQMLKQRLVFFLQFFLHFGEPLRHKIKISGQLADFITILNQQLNVILPTGHLLRSFVQGENRPGKNPAGPKEPTAPSPKASQARLTATADGIAESGQRLR